MEKGRETDGSIITYAEEELARIGAGPGEKSFTSVDSLILSWLAYLHFPADAAGWEGEGVPLARLFRAECFPELFAGVWDPADTRRLFTALVASPRFRDARVCGFTEQLDEDEGKQFAVVAFQLTPDLAYLAFRGTDSTLVGWREDFNLAFRTPVPSQEAAVRYVLEASEHMSGSLVCGGHSKGGNLAVYAAAMCPDVSVRSRIGRAFSHDGPGFLPSVLARPEFADMMPRIEKTLPQSSVVGLLLETQEGCVDIVRSRQVSILQHDPFSWVVEEGRFRPVEHLSVDAKYLDHTLNGWIAQMSPEERERLTDTLYGALSAADAHSFDEIRADWQSSVPAIMHALGELDPDTRSFLGRILGELAKRGVQSVPETLGDLFIPKTKARLSREVADPDGASKEPVV